MYRFSWPESDAVAKIRWPSNLKYGQAKGSTKLNGRQSYSRTIGAEPELHGCHRGNHVDFGQGYKVFGAQRAWQGHWVHELGAHVVEKLNCDPIMVSFDAFFSTAQFSAVVGDQAARPRRLPGNGRYKNGAPSAFSVTLRPHFFLCLPMKDFFLHQHIKLQATTSLVAAPSARPVGIPRLCFSLLDCQSILIPVYAISRNTLSFSLLTRRAAKPAPSYLSETTNGNLHGCQSEVAAHLVLRKALDNCHWDTVDPAMNRTSKVKFTKRGKRYVKQSKVKLRVWAVAKAKGDATIDKPPASSHFFKNQTIKPPRPSGLPVPPVPAENAQNPLLQMLLGQPSALQQLINPYQLKFPHPNPHGQPLPYGSPQIPNLPTPHHHGLPPAAHPYAPESSPIELPREISLEEYFERYKLNAEDRRVLSELGYVPGDEGIKNLDTASWQARKVLLLAKARILPQRRMLRRGFGLENYTNSKKSHESNAPGKTLTAR
ncbi:hypothetical protein B0H19DRAFT_1079579 [Mycena capillaripes]|nr:hypothetical protein B0H19DRAFT_1079579 [Mycena capillaripes]